MCGLTAAFNTKKEGKKTNKNNVNDIIINQFQNQCSRGQKGFGIIRINKGKIEVDRACETTKFLMDLYLKPSQMIIAHHRTPTSTDNLIDQTHPMWISNNVLDHDYLVVHNGVISNDDDLRLKHIELGFKYQTEYTEIAYNDQKSQVWNDSEAIAIELALFIEKKISAIGIDNAAAFIVLQIDKKTNKAKEVFFGKNGSYSDLNIYKAENVLQISSEGIGEKVKENILFSFEIKDPLMTLKETPVPFVKPVAIVEIKTTTPLDLPVANRTNDTKTNAIIAQSRKALERSWKDTYIAYSKDENYLPPYAGKDYIEEQKIAFRELIADEDCAGIETTTEKCLEEEADKIQELISDYKESLMLEKLDRSDCSYYTSQLFRITKAMQEIADIGEGLHASKLVLEKEEEEQEIADYNVGFGIVDPKNKADIEAERTMEIENAMTNEYGAYCGFRE